MSAAHPALRKAGEVGGAALPQDFGAAEVGIEGQHVLLGLLEAGVVIGHRGFEQSLVARPEA